MSYNLNQIDPDATREPYADPREEAPPARPRRVLAAGAALLVMGLFAAGLWFAYVVGLHHSSGGSNGSDIPLIRADTRPIKVKPANPGGMAIPDRNLLIYDEGHPTVEHLLSPPEQPMARPAPPRPQPAPPPPAEPSPSALGAALVLPAEPAPNPAAAPAAAPAHRGRPDEAAEQTASAPSASPRRVPREAARAEVRPASPGGVRLQLGSVRSAVSAREEWDRIKRSNSDLLHSLSAGAVRADLGEQGVYYRIQTTPVGNTARANRLCGELRQRHLDCIIVR
ncbi:MAG: SPOR domain-containing protein [Stellaceae bacterium]